MDEARNTAILHTARTSGFQVSQDFTDPRHLRHIGPLIKGGWQLSPDEEERLKVGGLPIPERVCGYFLVDTGAWDSAIDEDTAQELRLRCTGNRQVGGSTGAGSLNVYKASIFLELVTFMVIRLLCRSTRSLSLFPNCAKGMLG